jgi:hypothetical protein
MCVSYTWEVYNFPKINDRNLVVYSKDVGMNARSWMNLVDAEVFLVLFALIVKQNILAGREPELQHVLQHHSAKGTPQDFATD